MDEITATMDVEKLSDQIGADLFPSSTLEETEPAGDASAAVSSSTEAAVSAPATTETTAPVVQTRSVPKAWPKEMHDYWGKTDPKVQEYLELREKQMLEGLDQYKQAAQYGNALQQVLQPYHPILQQKGLDAPRAVADLMQAYVQLTQGTPESRWQAYQKIRENFGLQDPTAQPNGQSIDPQIQSLKQQFETMQQAVTAQQQASLQEARAKADQAVTAFAEDPTHHYFNDVAEDMTALLKSNASLSLQEAYDKAVWANPVTRAKEIARVQTEHEATLKENARLQALPKKKAQGVNVNGRETQRTSTEPLGTMDDTLRETFKAIKSR